MTMHTTAITGQDGRKPRRLAFAAGVAALAAVLAGAGLGANPAHAAGPLHLSVQGPTAIEAGFTTTYKWTLAASSAAAGIRLNLDVSGLRNPQISVSGAGGFACQRLLTNDFFEQCTGRGLGAGQTATFTVTGQAPFSGTISADGSINIGTQPDSVANLRTTVTAPLLGPTDPPFAPLL